MNPALDNYLDIMAEARVVLARLNYDPVEYQRWCNGIEDEDLFQVFQNAAFDPALTLRPAQIMPRGDWYTWFLRTARGWGKNRAASCAINALVTYEFPGQTGLIVGATFKDIRSTIFDGPSGLRATAQPGMEPEFFERGEIRWPNGSKAALRTSDNPEDIRGLSVPWCYCDEVIKWNRAETAFQNIQNCVREGAKPRLIITTSPLASQRWLQKVENWPDTIVTTGKSRENTANPDVYFRNQEASLGQGRKYQEEALGEWTSENAQLWTREQIAGVTMRSEVGVQTFAKSCQERVVSLDPGGKRDENGIVVLAMQNDHYWVLGDHSLAGKQSVMLAHMDDVVANYLQAGDRLIVETNAHGGLEETLQSRYPHLRVVGLHQAGTSKAARAEKAQMLYETGKVRHFLPMPQLEQQMEDFYDVLDDNTKSPDRVDALATGLKLLEETPRARIGVLNVNMGNQMRW